MSKWVLLSIGSDDSATTADYSCKKEVFRKIIGITSNNLLKYKRVEGFLPPLEQEILDFIQELQNDDMELI